MAGYLKMADAVDMYRRRLEQFAQDQLRRQEAAGQPRRPRSGPLRQPRQKRF
jgi:hypothetical protein